jgi:hypothetical protein
MAGSDVMLEGGGDELAASLELTPDLVATGLWEASDKGHIWPAVPAPLDFLYGMDMQKSPQVLADHDAVTTGRHEGFQVFNGTPIRVLDPESQLHVLVRRRLLRGDQTHSVVHGLI